MKNGLLDRRALLAGIAASSALLVSGCSGAEKGNTAGQGDASGLPPGEASSGSATRAGSALVMKVHRDPSCGCCESWAQIARHAGYRVDLQDDTDMAGVKRRLGVPEELASCHTTEIDGMVVEGHVPLDDVTRLLRQKPPGIRGIAVPGMPAGSPGMEVPGGIRQPFEVMAFDTSGKISVFPGHAAGETQKERDH